MFEAFEGPRLAAQLAVPCPAPAALAVDLDDAVFVDVLVVDAKGTPRPGHNVAVGGVTPGQSHIGKTDDAGRITLGPFQPAALQARAPLEPAQYSWTAKIFADVPAGARPSVTLQLPELVTVRATLAFDGAAPPTGFAGFVARSLRPGAEDVPVGADGTVPLELRPGDGVQIAIAARRWHVTIPENARSEHSIPIRWTGLAYSGTLRTPRGSPLRDTWIDATPIGGGGRTSVCTGDDGSFRLDGLDASLHRLIFSSSAARSTLAQQFVTLLPPANPPVALEPVVLGPAGDTGEVMLTGRVVDTSGQPIEATIVVAMLLPQEGGTLEVGLPWPPRKAAHDGRYRLPIPRGVRYRATIWRPGTKGAPHREEFTLPPSTTTAERDFVVR